MIVTQPSHQCGVLPGSTASFSVGAVHVAGGGGGAISYAWQYSNGSHLAGNRFLGTSNSTLTVSPVLEADNGSAFICIVTGGSGVSIPSQTVVLSVGEPVEMRHSVVLFHSLYCHNKVDDFNIPPLCRCAMPGTKSYFNNQHNISIV